MKLLVVWLVVGAPGALGANVPNLEGVPAHIRDKILNFHKVLSAPDNFSAAVTPAPPPRYGLAGLAEADDDDVMDRSSSTETPELQQDIFRFSHRISSPETAAGGSDVYSRLHRSKSRRKQRLEREWNQFLKWRRKQKQKRRIKRRILKAMRRKVEKRFGELSNNRWAGIRRNPAFKEKRRIIRKKINARLKQVKGRKPGGRKTTSSRAEKRKARKEKRKRIKMQRRKSRKNKRRQKHPLQ